MKVRSLLMGLRAIAWVMVAAMVPLATVAAEREQSSPTHHIR